MNEPIVSIIEAYGVELKKSGNAFKACCPFHYEKTPSFHVYPYKNHWRCYGECNTGGGIVEFWKRVNAISRA